MYFLPSRKGRQVIIAHASSPLTALSETQRAQALERFTIIRPALEKEITQAQVVHTHQLSLRTIQRWMKRYREQGVTGLTNTARSDKGTPRSLPQTAIGLIEGLALQTPPSSAISIHRQVTTIAKEQGWKPPSYARVRQIIKQLDPALVTFAHQGLLPIARNLTCSTGGDQRHCPYHGRQRSSDSPPAAACGAHLADQ